MPSAGPLLRTLQLPRLEVLDNQRLPVTPYTTPAIPKRHGWPSVNAPTNKRPKHEDGRLVTGPGLAWRLWNSDSVGRLRSLWLHLSKQALIQTGVTVQPVSSERVVFVLFVGED